MSYELRFRQVHLDFHTSPAIPGIGEQFNRQDWQDALKTGHVDSITVFAKCHHGWSYHPTGVGRMHPHLQFDLLAEQIAACRDIDVRTPIYLSAGVDNVAAEAHPEWREISVEGRYQGWSGAINRPGFKTLCFRGAYLDYLCDQIREVVRLYPVGHGIFLDIISQGPCCCRACVESMLARNLDIDRPEDCRLHAEQTLERYYRETTAACRCIDPDMPVFHNSGHIQRGRRDRLTYFSHLELESLPTGGWGYDHFPASAAYCRNIGLDFLGMTGKFHRSWGEFGGFKHPNALRYECSLMLALGAKCSVGDQLHPNGAMDPDTYRLIGEAYAEVEQKSAWCRRVTPVADIAVLTGEDNTRNARHAASDAGAVRMLLEEHFLFDLIDRDHDFDRYRLLILPDAIRLDAGLAAKLRRYLENGGRLLLSGTSGLRDDADEFAIPVGASYEGISEDQPDYFVAGPLLGADTVHSPLVMYQRSHRVAVDDAEILATIERPYFNRQWDHFCSHQHAPNAGPAGHPAAVRRGPVLYLAHPVFSHYYAMGAVAYRQIIGRAVRLLLDDQPTLSAALPSGARATLMHQADENRYVLHLLYATPALRGGAMTQSPEGFVVDGAPVEVIEDLTPLCDVEVSVSLPATIERITLEPQGRDLPFSADGKTLSFTLDRLVCHQMVVMTV